MTSPLFLVAPGTLPDGTAQVHLDGPEGRHAADVQRLAPGERVLLSDTRGRYAVCTVEQAGRGSLDLRVEELGEEPEPEVRLVLVQALVNLLAVFGMAPLTGVPLPLVSYGNASMMIMLAAIGLLLNIARGGSVGSATRPSSGGARLRVVDGAQGGHSRGGNRGPRRTSAGRARR